MVPGNSGIDSVTYSPSQTALNPTISVIQGGLYTFYFTDVQCSDTNSVEIFYGLGNQITIDEVICDTSYTWDNQTYNQSGAYVNSYYNVNGCDSVVTLNLSLNGVLPVDFTVNQNLFTAPPFAAQFTNTTPNPSNYNFTWGFSDGTMLQSNNSSVFHEYLYNGLYV